LQIGHMAAPDGGLSAYELTRAENIRRNNQYLLSLGLDVAAEQVRKPKPPPKPKSPKPITEVKASRSSSRLCGLPADPVEDLEPEPAWEPDEKKPKRGEAGLSCWWLPATECDPLGPPRPPLTECQELALLTPLTSEQRESLVLEGGEEEGDWVTEMLRFLRAYGAQRPEAFCVPSVANFKKVIDTLSVLASGDGVTCAYRGGTFDAGVKYTPKHDLDEALRRALQWLPKAKDKSNGWTFTHPFEKMKQYQRALFWKHLFPFVWEETQPTGLAASTAMAMAASAEGAEAERWLAMATVEPVVEPAATAVEEVGGSSAAGISGGLSGAGVATANVAVDAGARAAAQMGPTTQTAANADAAAVPFTLEMVAQIIEVQGVEHLTGKLVREALESQLRLAKGGLLPLKAEISRAIDETMESMRRTQGGAVQSGGDGPEREQARASKRKRA